MTLDISDLPEDKQQTLAAILADWRGEPWEVRNKDGRTEWRNSSPHTTVAWYIANGYYVRPAPKPARWAAEKAAHAAGKVVEHRHPEYCPKWKPVPFNCAWMPEWEYRIRPWDLDAHCLAHFGPMPEGATWHRTDFTEEDLEGGWRPLLIGEGQGAGDEWQYPNSKEWTGEKDIPHARRVKRAHAGEYKHRTRRPYPQPPRMVPWTRDTCPPLPFEVKRKDNGYRATVIGAGEFVKVNGIDWDWLTFLERFILPNGSPCGTVEGIKP